MSVILRWHVSRIHEPEMDKTNEPRVIHFKITPQAGDVLAERFGNKEAALADGDSDKLEWWHLDDEQEIEGQTSEPLIIETLAAKNVHGKSGNAERVLEKRQLKENMVLLQIVRDKTGLDEALAKIKTSGKGLADVSPLVKIKNAGWLDFTQQARTMAAAIYHEVLGEKEVSEDATQ